MIETFVFWNVYGLLLTMYFDFSWIYVWICTYFTHLSYTSFWAENTYDTFEVSRENLKLLYTADKGNLMRYINRRNSLSYFVEALI